jgi:hypothetical protein
MVDKASLFDFDDSGDSFKSMAQDMYRERQGQVH